MKCLYLQDGVISYRTDHQPEHNVSGLMPVDVVLAGICETDLQLQKGYMGFKGVPGHEFVGIAAEGKHIGRRVVGEINCVCGNCVHCLNGRSRHCSMRTVIGILNHDGAFAERVWLPEQNLHAVPDNVSNEEAVFTEPLAAACRIPEQVAIQKTDDIIIFGDGRLGHLCAAVLSKLSDNVMVVGKHQWKMDQFSRLRVSTCRLSDFSPAGNADIVVDCTGTETGLEVALQSVRPCGTVVLKTTVASNHQIAMSPAVIDEITIVGSRCGPFEPALKMLNEKTVDLSPLISARYPLSDGEEAFQRAQQADTLKVLLEVSSENDLT